MKMAQYSIVNIEILIMPDETETGRETDFLVRRDNIINALQAKYGGVFRVQGYTRDLTIETGQPSLVFDINNYLADVGCAYNIALRSPSDKQITRKAKWVRFAVGSDFVDLEDADTGLEPLPHNRYSTGCSKCGFPDLDNVPNPYHVIRGRLRKNTEAFFAINAIMVVRPRILDLLNRVVGNQIRSGPVKIVGHHGRRVTEAELYWIRPVYALGRHANILPSDPCSNCGRVVQIGLRSRHIYAKILDHFVDSPLDLDIARIPDLTDLSLAQAKQKSIAEVAISGRLYWYLKQNKMRGLVGPGDDDMYFSMRPDEPPLDPDRQPFPVKGVAT